MRILVLLVELPAMAPACCVSQLASFAQCDSLLGQPVGMDFSPEIPCSKSVVGPLATRPRPTHGVGHRLAAWAGRAARQPQSQL